MQRIVVNEHLVNLVTGGVIITQGKRGIAAARVDGLTVHANGDIDIRIGPTARACPGGNGWQRVDVRPRTIVAGSHIRPIGMPGMVGLFRKVGGHAVCIRTDRNIPIFLCRGYTIGGAYHIALPDFNQLS